jgi:hypothetical protein
VCRACQWGRSLGGLSAVRRLPSSALLVEFYDGLNEIDDLVKGWRQREAPEARRRRASNGRLLGDSLMGLAGISLLMICNTDGASWRGPRKPANLSHWQCQVARDGSIGGSLRAWT